MATIDRSFERAALRAELDELLRRLDRLDVEGTGSPDDWAEHDSIRVRQEEARGRVDELCGV